MARILVTDDAAFMRLQLRDILTKLGHEVVGEAADGKEAVDQYDGLLPDLVTMDITMPEMDGVEAAKAIIKKHPDAKIIMCSAMGQQTMVVDAVKLGAKDFIVKPFTPERVQEAVERVV